MDNSISNLMKAYRQIRGSGPASDAFALLAIIVKIIEDGDEAKYLRFVGETEKLDDCLLELCYEDFTDVIEMKFLSKEILFLLLRRELPSRPFEAAEGRPFGQYFADSMEARLREMLEKEFPIPIWAIDSNSIPEVLQQEFSKIKDRFVTGKPE